MDVYGWLTPDADPGNLLGLSVGGCAVDACEDGGWELLP